MAEASSRGRAKARFFSDLPPITPAKAGCKEEPAEAGLSPDELRKQDTSGGAEED